MQYSGGILNWLILPKTYCLDIATLYLDIATYLDIYMYSDLLSRFFYFIYRKMHWHTLQS